MTTLQWLDLLLPEYQFLKAAPAFGGDADSALSMHVNPFRRRQEAPVVFWSGIVAAGPDKKVVKWQVPDYFNGNLRVMAVAVREDSIGVTESSSLVKSPIILVPNAPLFVAPGDEFEASIALTNNLGQPGDADPGAGGAKRRAGSDRRGGGAGGARAGQGRHGAFSVPGKKRAGRGRAEFHRQRWRRGGEACYYVIYVRPRII